MSRRKELRRYRPGTNDATSEYCHTGSSYKALARVNRDDANRAVDQHLRGSWGECDPAVFENGDFGGAHGILRLTVHFDRHGVKFGVVTTLDKLDTTVIMPDEL